jgi:hypothetical protein
MMRRNFNPSIIGALAAAAMLLAAGVLMAVYEENLYSAQQIKNVREQAQILAASVSAGAVRVVIAISSPMNRLLVDAATAVTVVAGMSNTCW